MPLQHLLLGSINEEQLDVSVDGLTSIWGADSIQGTPFLIAFQVVPDDLDRVFRAQCS